MHKLPFVNLDAITECRVEFQLGGKTRRLKDITAETYMRFCNAWASMQVALDQKDISEDQSFTILSNLILSVCDEVTSDEIRKLTIAQMGVLVNLIHQSVTGQEEIKKKALQLMREPVKRVQ